MNPSVADLGQQAVTGRLLDRDQGNALAAIGGDDLYDLFYWANRIRLAHFGRAVTTCAIAAAKSGACTEDCRFCAQSARHRTPGAAPAKMTDDQIVAAAEAAAEAGAGCFGIVNSGRSPTDAELDWLAGAFAKVRALGRTGLCASLGCLSEPQARRLYDLGVRRYNHNLETSRRFFSRIVTTHTFDDRVATLRNCRSAGLRLCSGGIFNLGEDWDDRIDMAMTLRDLGVDMAPMNFLNPIPGTPLADRAAMPPMEILKVVAVYRFLLPRTEIKLAGGGEVNLRDLQSWMFYCGATSCMVGNYLTTSGRPAAEDRQLIGDLGLTIADCGSPISD